MGLQAGLFFCRALSSAGQLLLLLQLFWRRACSFHWLGPSPQKTRLSFMGNFFLSLAQPPVSSVFWSVPLVMPFSYPRHQLAIIFIDLALGLFAKKIKLSGGLSFFVRWPSPPEDDSFRRWGSRLALFAVSTSGSILLGGPASALW